MIVIILLILSIIVLATDKRKHQHFQLNYVMCIITGFIAYMIYGYKFNNNYLLDFEAPFHPYGTGQSTVALLLCIIPGIIISAIVTLIRILKERR